MIDLDVSVFTRIVDSPARVEYLVEASPQARILSGAQRMGQMIAIKLANIGYELLMAANRDDFNSVAERVVYDLYVNILDEQDIVINDGKALRDEEFVVDLYLISADYDTKRIDIGVETKNQAGTIEFLLLQ